VLDLQFHPVAARPAKPRRANADARVAPFGDLVIQRKREVAELALAAEVVAFIIETNDAAVLDRPTFDVPRRPKPGEILAVEDRLSWWLLNAKSRDGARSVGNRKTKRVTMTVLQNGDFKLIALVTESVGSGVNESCSFTTQRYRTHERCLSAKGRVDAF